MPCDSCGTLNDADSRFCGICGAQLAASAPTEQVNTDPAGGEHDLCDNTEDHAPESFAGEQAVQLPTNDDAPADEAGSQQTGEGAPAEHSDAPADEAQVQRAGEAASAEHSVAPDFDSPYSPHPNGNQSQIQSGAQPEQTIQIGAYCQNAPGMTDPYAASGTSTNGTPTNSATTGQGFMHNSPQMPGTVGGASQQAPGMAGGASQQMPGMAGGAPQGRNRQPSGVNMNNNSLNIDVNRLRHQTHHFLSSLPRRIDFGSTALRFVSVQRILPIIFIAMLGMPFVRVGGSVSTVMGLFGIGSGISASVPISLSELAFGTGGISMVLNLLPASSLQFWVLLVMFVLPVALLIFNTAFAKVYVKSLVNLAVYAVMLIFICAMLVKLYSIGSSLESSGSLGSLGDFGLSSYITVTSSPVAWLMIVLTVIGIACSLCLIGAGTQATDDEV